MERNPGPHWEYTPPLGLPVSKREIAIQEAYDSRAPMETTPAARGTPRGAGSKERSSDRTESGDMSGVLTSLIREYREQLQRHRNRPFLRAAMAACATVAMANGIVELRQRVRVDQIMEALDALKVFDPHEGVDLFNEYADAIRKNPVSGHARALAAVDEEVAAEPEKAGLLIRVCLAVSAQDGQILEPERREILTLCSRYGLDAAAIGLDSVTSAGQ